MCNRLLTVFVCLLIYEFWISLWKIARCSVILLLTLIIDSSTTNDGYFCFCSFILTFCVVIVAFDSIMFYKFPKIVNQDSYGLYIETW